MHHSFAGTWKLLRLIGRLDRIKLPMWLFGLGLLVAITPLSLRGLTETEAEAQGITPEAALAQQAAVLETNGAAVAFQGPPNAIDTFGGRYAFEIGAFTFALIGLMNILLVARHTRAEEESGRTEMVRSASVGAWSSIAAVTIAAIIANLFLAAVTTVVFVADGLAVWPSALFGLSLALAGMVFAATALIFVQIFEYGRASTGASIAAIGVAFAFRAVGDVQDNWLSLLSPIGWAQAINPYGEIEYWPIAVLVANIAASFGVAIALILRRDVGAGLISQRPGPARAKASLLSPLGLAWRLQRSTLTWWAIGLACLSAVYGSVISSLDELIGDSESMIEALEQYGISLESLRDGFISFILSTVALVAIGGVVQSVLRPRGEENGGRAEPILGTGVSRPAWLGSHLLLAAIAAPVFMLASGAALGLADFAVAGQLTDFGGLLWASLVRVPALWAVSGIGALLYGVSKRISLAVWAYFGLIAVVFMFGELLQMPDWIINLSPLPHLTHAPLDPQGWTAVIVLTAIGAAGMTGSVVGFATRDLESPS